MSERKRFASVMLHERGVFPDASSRCLEVGYGTSGWLSDLIGWGVPETNISGIELDAQRAGIARQLLPAADLRVGDAAGMPWPDESFHLVVASTVFTSILDQEVRRQVADEITRVLAPGGALLWYDFTFNNPNNANVKKVTKKELRSLFPALSGETRSLTLAPPIARPVARMSWTLATMLGALPFLRTHLLAVLVKDCR
ncbi:MAG: class I SAM-dependent methyltransferase [Bacteroidetes bacterium]|nr:class I SAM-dependent methyltransferase [Bacteroidota bacterium]